MQNRQRIYEGLGELLTDLLEEVNEGFPNDKVFNVDSGEQLRDNIDPDLEVDLIEAIPDDGLDLRDVAMAEPEFQEAQRVLQGLRSVRGKHLIIQGQLLDQALYRTYYMINVVLSKYLLFGGGINRYEL